MLATRATTATAKRFIPLAWLTTGTPPASTGPEQRHALPDRVGRLRAELRVVVAADRVRDHRLGHQLRGAREPIRHDGRGRRACLLGRDRVVQTARRAAPSIADGG